MESIIVQAKRVISASMDQWTGTLSKIAPQSHLCVESWTIPYSDVALTWLGKPPAGQDMRQQSGHLDWQITQAYHSNASSPVLPFSVSLKNLLIERAWPLDPLPAYYLSSGEGA